MGRKRKTQLETDIEIILGRELGLVNPFVVRLLVDYVNANYSRKKSSAPAKAPESTTAHPGLLAFRSVTNRWPNKALWDEVARAVGDDPVISTMDKCYRAWLAAGRNPMAITWLTEWYPFALMHNGNIPTYKDTIRAKVDTQSAARTVEAATIEDVIFGK